MNRNDSTSSLLSRLWGVAISLLGIAVALWLVVWIIQQIWIWLLAGLIIAAGITIAVWYVRARRW
mgnify:FL=1